MPRNGTNWGSLTFLRQMTLPRSTAPVSRRPQFNHHDHDTEPVPPRGTLDHILLRPEQTGWAVVYPMIHAVDPRQNRLFDPFDGVIPPLGRRIIADGWQGLFRHVLLEVMPVAELGRHFSDSLGAPTKELYSMAGLVFLADFFGWNAQEAIEAYVFRSDVQYALNREPGAEVSTRTLERYQKLFRDDDLAARVFEE